MPASSLPEGFRPGGLRSPGGGREQMELLFWPALAASVCLHLLLLSVMFLGARPGRSLPAGAPLIIGIHLGVGGSDEAEDSPGGERAVPAPEENAFETASLPPSPPTERAEAVPDAAIAPQEALPRRRVAPPRETPAARKQEPGLRTGRQERQPAATPASANSLAAGVAAQPAGRGTGSSGGGPEPGSGAAGGGTFQALGSPDGPGIIRLTRPEYPEAARRQNISGAVRLLFALDERGRVGNVRVEQSAGALLDEAARKALLSARFRPARGSSGPKACVTAYVFVFTLR